MEAHALCAVCLERQKNRECYQARRARGVCSWCGQPRPPGMVIPCVRRVWSMLLKDAPHPPERSFCLPPVIFLQKPVKLPVHSPRYLTLQ